MKKKMTDDKKENELSTKRTLIALIAVLLIMASLYLISAQYLKPVTETPIYTEISVDDTIPSPAIFIDVRPYTKFNISHIGGAKSIPYSNCSTCFKSRVSIYDFNKNYVLYGPESYNASAFMHNLGFRYLYILTDYYRWTGGIA